MSGARREHPHGTVTEMFSFGCSRVVAMTMDEGDKKSLPTWGAGPFVVNLYVQAITHIMMTTCCVGGVRWPLSRDSLVIRVGERSFAFVMLGLLYGFQLPSACDEDTVDTLERAFIKFSDYTTILDHGANGYPCTESESTFWATARPVIRSIIRVKLGKSWLLTEGKPGESMSKVARISATTDTVSNGIVDGLLKPAYVDHFVVWIPDRHKRYTESEEAFSSVSAITDVVSSLEMLWNITAGDQQALQVANREDGSVQTVRIRLWKLNHLGIAFFLHQKSNALLGRFETYRDEHGGK